MITKDTLQKALYFDIETAGLYPTFEELKLKDQKLSEHWSKRCKWLRINSGPEFINSTDSELWLEKASLHPEFGRVVCFSAAAYDSSGELRYMSLIGVESDILIGANKILNNSHSKGLKLAGHTIKNFDIPFLGKRMIINGIKPSEIINSFNKKPWEMTHLDISEIAGFGGWGQTHSSLDLMCCTLKIDSPKDEMSGAKVHEAFWSGKIEEIKKYCEKDVEAVIKVFNKFQF